MFFFWGGGWGRLKFDIEHKEHYYTFIIMEFGASYGCNHLGVLFIPMHIFSVTILTYSVVYK